MTRASKLIAGYDYVKQLPVEYTREQWREIIRHAIYNGARRAVVDGETHLYQAHVLIAEVYCNIAI